MDEENTFNRLRRIPIKQLYDEIMCCELDDWFKYLENIDDWFYQRGWTLEEYLEGCKENLLH